jgi:hypothetical protein
MSAASEKAADRMHADLDAMISDAERHYTALRANGQSAEASKWYDAHMCLRIARGKITECMNERDRKLAAR